MKIVVIGNFARWLINFRGAMLKAMVDMGHTVYACAPNASGSVIEKLEKMGVHYIDIPVNRDGSNPFKEIQSFLSMAGLFNKLKPDLVFGYTVKPVIYGTLAARLTGVPSVFSLVEGLGYVFSHSNKNQRGLRLIIFLLYGLTLPLNKKVFFLNARDHDRFVGGCTLPRRRAVLLDGIGVDLSYYSPVPLPRKISFLFAARLIYDKGIEAYVAAAETLKKKYPRVEFKVAGWIDDNPSAIKKELLQGWKDKGLIQYLGNLDGIRSALANASVLVLPTFYREGMPRSIIEAMAMGRPVITTDIPGCNDAVFDGINGFLVPVRQTGPLVEKMEACILNPGLVKKMGERGLKIARQRFDEKKINTDLFKNMGLL